MFPQLSHALTGTILSRFTLVGPDQPDVVTFLASVQRCDCTNAADESQEVRLGFWNVRFRYTSAAFKEHDCFRTFHLPVVLIPRIPPSTHFGHQMLTIIPALAAVKLFMLHHGGLDITKLPLVFVDRTGKCSHSCGH
jgi:hypothetical protein